jgi:hypothetical protein
VRSVRLRKTRLESEAFGAISVASHDGRLRFGVGLGIPEYLGMTVDQTIQLALRLPVDHQIS